MRTASELANSVLRRLSNDSPSEYEQAKLLIDAIQKHMASKTKTNTAEINTKFISVTGDIKNKNAIDCKASVENLGKDALYNGINEYFNIPGIKDKYSMHIINSVASVIIPSSAHRSNQSREFITSQLSSMGSNAIKYAEREWKKEFNNTKLTPDFFMNNALPSERNLKINSSLTYGNSDMKGNNILSSQTPSGGNTVPVGNVFASIVFKDMAKEIDLLQDIEKELSRVGNVTGKLFENINLKLETFIPMKISNNKLAEILEKKVISRADAKAMEAASNYLSEVLLRSIKEYTRK